MSYQFTHAAETNGQAQESDRFDHLRGTLRRQTEVVAGKGRVDRPRGCGGDGGNFENHLFLRRWNIFANGRVASGTCQALRIEKNKRSFAGKIRLRKNFEENIQNPLDNVLNILYNTLSCTWRSELAEFTQRIFPVLALPRATT